MLNLRCFYSDFWFYLFIFSVRPILCFLAC
jgi:hypothetical protein